MTNISTETQLPQGNTTKVITQSINVKIIKHILNWQAAPLEYHPQIGTKCHCLLRIYDFESQNRAVVIASSLWSNDGNYDIWETYANLIVPVVELYPKLANRLVNIDWIAHSGQFSYPLSWSETSHKDQFDLMSISFDERNEAKISADEVEISLKQVEELINFMPLESAAVVLQQLEHDNDWNGIVDEHQVKACWELENDIVADRFEEIKSIGR